MEPFSGDPVSPFDTDHLSLHGTGYTGGTQSQGLPPMAPAAGSRMFARPPAFPSSPAVRHDDLEEEVEFLHS